jgi:hypothetical protein
LGGRLCICWQRNQDKVATVKDIALRENKISVTIRPWLRQIERERRLQKVKSKLGATARRASKRMRQSDSRLVQPGLVRASGLCLGLTHPQGQVFCVAGPTISRALSPDLVKLLHERTTRHYVA